MIEVGWKRHHVCSDPFTMMKDAITDSINRWQEDKDKQSRHCDRCNSFGGKCGWRRHATKLNSSKASRWEYSRAATGRGAGRASCGLHKHREEQ